MPVVGDLRVLLRLRDFRNLLAVRLLSQAADGVYQVALATYVVFSPEKQASPGAIASAMAVLLLPYSVVGPFAGVLLDRWRRRQVFLYGNLLRAVLACGTALLIVAHVPDWLFYASALSVTAVNRFVLAGLAASLPHVAGAGQLVTANALSPTAGTLAAVAGGGWPSWSGCWPPGPTPSSSWSAPASTCSRVWPPCGWPSDSSDPTIRPAGATRRSPRGSPSPCGAWPRGCGTSPHGATRPGR